VSKRILLATLAGTILAAPDSQHRPATYLAVAKTNLCERNCSTTLLPAHYWFCFKTEDRVLLGQTIAWDWQYHSRSMDIAQGPRTTVSLRYDKNRIWVRRPDGGELKLDQDYSFKPLMGACINLANKRRSNSNWAIFRPTHLSGTTQVFRHDPHCPSLNLSRVAAFQSAEAVDF